MLLQKKLIVCFTFSIKELEFDPHIRAGVNFYFFYKLFNYISKYISYLDIFRFLQTYPDPEGFRVRTPFKHL